MRLRPLVSDDLETTLSWRNHPDSRVWFHTSHVITPEEHAGWFERYLARDDDHMFVLELDDRPVAQVALYDVAGGTAEFGRLLVDPELRGRGLSHQAITLCIDVARDQLGLKELWLEVKRDNARAIRAYESTGFVPDPTTVGKDDALVMRRQL